MRPFITGWLVTMMVVLLGAACGSGDESPLATWDPSTSDTFNQSTTGVGTLEISADCVRLVLDNKTTILIMWPEPTSWNASSQAIEFVGVRGERIELRDGDRITAGGAPPRPESRDGDRPIPGAAIPTGEPVFVPPYDPPCETEEAFVTHTVSLVTN